MMEVNEDDVIVNIDNNNPASTANTPESQIIMSEDVGAITFGSNLPMRILPRKLNHH